RTPMLKLPVATIRPFRSLTAIGMTRLATSPLLALAVAIAACWFLGWSLPEVRPRPDACMPAPGIPAELLGYHGAKPPCDPEDAPWIVRAVPGEATEGVDGPANPCRPDHSRGDDGSVLTVRRDPIIPSRRR